MGVRRQFIEHTIRGKMGGQAAYLEAICDLCYWEDEAACHAMFFGAAGHAGTDLSFIGT